MKVIEYKFVDGPLDGQVGEYTGTATWWGFRYANGEYNTRVTTYKTTPPQMYWRDDSAHVEPQWELCEDVDGEALDEHVKRLLDGQQG